MPDLSAMSMSSSRAPEEVDEHEGGEDEEEGNPEKLLEGVNQMLGGGRDGQESSLVNAIGTLLFSAPVLYPFSFATQLIQLGYEASPPTRQYSAIFRRHMYYYPGIFGYMRAIVRKDGYSVLYTGVYARLLGQAVTIAAHRLIKPHVISLVNKLPLSVVDDSNGNVPDTEENVNTPRSILIKGIKDFLSHVVAKSLIQVVVHPFEVVAVRSAAQYIGRESEYSTMFGSFREIYAQEGFSGFYVGFVPTILGHMCHSAIQCAIWTSFELLVLKLSTSWSKACVRLLELPTTMYFPRSYSYPFTLISRTMMVNNCGMAAWMPPQFPVFTSWRDCYSYLRSTGNLYRGSVVLLPRFAKGSNNY